MKRRVMSMLAGAILAASTFLTPGVASAATQPPSPPAEFGTDWHDPVTAAPPVTRPHTTACEVTVAEAQFRDFTPYTGTYTPPEGCGDRWSKVVLRLEGKVKGRQYDRLGSLHIGGVLVLQTSTPEPSPDGIAWNVEKDVTRYSATLRSPQPVSMLIGNTVNDTYTGVIDTKVTLTFYAAAPSTRPARTPDRILTPAADGTLTTPRNTERLLAEVYATGSGGGCEETWYLTVPTAAGYSCKADNGPYREVQIRVDGQLAGIAAPFPNVWTGGWSNPFLWYVIPGPRAFDVKPIEYDLTPFAGLLNDGRPHRIEASVLGVPADQSGWSPSVNVLAWQDAGRAHVTGALTHSTAGPLTNATTYTPAPAGELNRLDNKGGHSLTTSGYLDTSHGRITTTVTRTLTSRSAHQWTASEDTDAIKATWNDRENVGTGGHATRTDRTYTMDGTVTLGTDDRLRTVITLGDRSAQSSGKEWSVLDDTYTGDASYASSAPREERHAVGVTSERYRAYGPALCYDRELRTEQGMLTLDRTRC
ncbi:peptide-N4-asparagine amidase [Streptomyces sp. NPDC050738]|uniref:peptide-N4-asparagine amidase n=1 Tax=Streptomyces sp. NPDC050738 TaxID=3154744 RepID=UPI00341F098F